MKEFLKTRHLKGLKKRGYNIYTIDNEISIDKIYKFEDLKESLIHLQKKLSLPEEIILPRAKSKYRIDKRHFTEMFDDEEKLTIQDKFSDEIKLFNYSFKK